MFELDPRLAADTVKLCEWPLSTVLLMNDARYPWVILVPRRAGVTEAFELSSMDQAALALESTSLARLMSEYFQAEKMNVAALGNVVPQLHVHHVARHRGDEAWPRPVWGLGESRPYDEGRLATLCHELVERCRRLHHTDT